MNEQDVIILDVDDFIKTLNRGRYVYCGSISLYLNGMHVDNFSDVDVDFIDLSENDKAFVWPFGGPLDVDAVRKIDVSICYHEVQFHGRNLLCSTLEYEIQARQWLIANIEGYVHKDKCIKRIHDIEEFLSMHISKR